LKLRCWAALLNTGQGSQTHNHKPHARGIDGGYSTLGFGDYHESLCMGASHLLAICGASRMRFKFGYRFPLINSSLCAHGRAFIVSVLSPVHCSLLNQQLTVINHEESSQ